MRFPTLCNFLLLLFILGQPLFAHAELFSSQSSSRFNLCEIDQMEPASIICQRRPDGLPGALDLAGSPGFYDQVWAITRTRELFSIQPSTATSLTSVALSIDTDETIWTLAIDPKSNAFYGTTETELLKLNPETAEVDVIGQLGQTVDRGLAFDTEGILYGVANDNQLFTINTSSGAAELVGTIPLRRIEDLAFDPKDNQLYGVGFGTHGEPGSSYQLYRISPSDASLEPLGQSMVRPSGLAFTDIPACGIGTGDFDRDGSVTFADFLLLTGKFGEQAHTSNGDIDCDQLVGFSDFLILSRNFEQAVDAVHLVPEPNCVPPAVFGLFILLCRRRNHRAQ